MCNSICPEFESSQKGLEISRSYQIGDRHEEIMAKVFWQIGMKIKVLISGRQMDKLWQMAYSFRILSMSPFWLDLLNTRK